MPFIGGGRTAGADIRILSPRALSDAAAPGYGEVPVAVREAARQVVLENAPSLIRTRTVREAVQMVVKQETSNTASAAAPNQSASAPVVLQAATTGPATMSAAVQSLQAMQPKIDVNRITDEVYRMLERRLISERERRGR